MARRSQLLSSELKRIVELGVFGTQEELCDELKKEGFEVTQSTVSRSLRKIGAIRAALGDGRTVYRLPDELPTMSTSLENLVRDIQSNGSVIVMRTTPGSASLVARHLDHSRPAGILGTIAGDDTIFVAPTSAQAIRETVAAIRNSLAASGN